MLSAALTPLSARCGDIATPSGHTFNASPGTNTLMAARDAARAWHSNGHAGMPATIILAPGDYTLTETLTLDSQDSDVTWKAGNSGKVSILGGKKINDLEMVPSGGWRANVDFSFEQLYANGHRLTRNRLPLDGFYDVENVKQEELPGNKARLTVTMPPAEASSLPGDARVFQGAQILVFHKWDTSRYQISSADPHTGTFAVEGKRMLSSDPWDTQSRFILDNCGIAGNLPSGMWFLDKNTLNYRPLENEKIQKTEMYAPVIEKFVRIEGSRNVHFDGLKFYYTAYRLPADGCPPAQAAALIGAAIEVDEASGVTFANCEIAHTGNYALWFRRGCHDCRIEHSLLRDLGAGGIRIGEMAIRDNPDEQTHDIVADNNIIHGCGRVHPSAVGVWIGQSANNRVTHNDISDTFYTAVSVGWTWGYGRSLATNNFIGFNRIHKIGQGALSDMGGFYTLGVSPGSACIGNVIFDVRAHDYGGWGIYPDEGSTGWQIESNLVWNCTCVSPHGGGAFHQHYGATNFIANNIFAFSSGPPMQATRVENHLSFSLERNIIVSSNAEFFTGPWNKIEFQSSSNCFAYYGPPRLLFPYGNLAAWQSAGFEPDSVLTNLVFNGTWPDVTLSGNSPATALGFINFDTKAAGIYGDRSWKNAVANP